MTGSRLVFLATLAPWGAARLFLVGLLTDNGRLEGGSDGRGRRGVSGEEEEGVGGRGDSSGSAILIWQRERGKWPGARS